jgi:signal transduction histidine kinase
MSPRLRLLLDNLLSPLLLAAYVAWGVVWVGGSAGFAALGPTGELLARLALVAFLAGFMACTSELLDARPWAYRTLCLLLAVCALGLIASNRSGVTPILLVLMTATLAAHLQGRELLLWVVALNLGFLAILAWGWQLEGRGLWITAVAHFSFQAFAALLMRTARRAEDMAGQLRATNAELLTTRTLLAESVRDQERLRLSRELHDVAGHGLTALKLNLESLARDPRQPDPQRTELCRSLADELLQNLRRVVSQMRAEPGIDLRAALERLALPFPRPRLRLELPDGAELADRGQVEAVLRAVQEGLTNAARHGHARELHVRLEPVGAEWVLHIDDDGRSSGEIRMGGGLAGMRERFEQLGGLLQTGRSESGGLRLEARWPRETPP